jgi:hypothetical protein
LKKPKKDKIKRERREERRRAKRKYYLKGF